MIILPRKKDEIIVLTKWSKWLLTTFLIVIIINSARLETECPSYKPYKTDAGCVAKCPQDLVINGSSCNITCGSWFTDANRVCQPECKENYFIKEKLRAIGWYLYLEKQCIQSCARSELVFNRTCVEACPAGFTYFVNESCLEKCPNEFSYLINVTKGNNILHRKCTKTCPYLENNNNCVSSCPVDKRQLNWQCVNTCPQTYQFMDGNRCVEQCPFERKFDSNKTCVSSCPSHLPILQNTSCVANCSKEFMFVDKLLDGSKICVDVCGKENKFVLNNECVPKCPRLTFNRTCVDKCPNQSPIVNNVTMGRNCIFGNTCSELFYYDACVGKCPNGKYFLVHQNICVDICPENTVLANNTCLQSCGEISPYVEKTYVDYFIWSNKYFDRQYRKVWKKNYVTTSVFKCVENCSNETLYFNYTCVDNCPMETKLSNSFEVPWNLTSIYIRNGRTCVRECPTDAQFIVRHYIKDTINSYLICMASCPENTYIFRNMCLPYCPDFMVDQGNFCVQKCPRIRHLLEERTLTIYSTVKRQYTKISMFQCVATCDTEFISNNVCVKFCPEINPYIDRNYCHNNTCGKLYEQQTSKGILCVPECPNDTIINFNKCSTSCSRGAVLHQKSCLHTCPKLYPYNSEIKMTMTLWTTGENVGWLAKTFSVVRYECLKTCHSKQVVDTNMKCTNYCPPEEKYLDGIFCHNKTCGEKYENKTSTGISCLEKCPNETVHLMNKCSTQCSEKYKYILDTTCVEECPPVSKLVINSSLNIFSIASVFHEYLEHKGLTCLSKCPYWTLQHGNICTAKCPEELEYEYDFKCVDTCPRSSPLIVDTSDDLLFSSYRQISKYRCLSRCENNKLYQKDKQKCIYEYSCKYPYIEHDGQCLTHCPKGYKWFNGCFNVTATIISLIFLSVLTCLCFVNCRVLLIETNDFLGICRQYTQHDKNVIKPNILLLHMKKEDMNVRTVSKDTPSEVCLDTLSLHLADGSHINKCLEEETNV